MLELVAAGRNVFVTGVGGTGKSFVLERVIAALRARHGPGAVAVAAPTGVAALLVGGATLHGLAGVGLGESVRHFGMMWARARARGGARAPRALVLDEVSMLEAEFLDHLDATCRAVRDARDAPFGGVQLVFAGDFLQLPGVAAGS